MKKYWWIYLAVALAASACGSARVKFAAPTLAAGVTPAASAATPAGISSPVGTDLDVALPAGDPARGDKLFHGKVNGQYPCSACHSLTPGRALVGPSLGHIATTAAARRDGYPAERYIHESIVSPNAYAIAGYNQNIMPVTFGAQMSPQDLADLIAFLMTLK